MQGGISIKMENAIEAIAIDSAMDDFVSFAPDDNSFTLVSINDSGEAHSFKFVCADAPAAALWRHHLLPGGQQQNAAAGLAPISKADASNPLVLQLQQELRTAQEQLAQSSESVRSTSQKLSSMDLAYKCPSFCLHFIPVFRVGSHRCSFRPFFHVNVILQGPEGTKPAASGAKRLICARHATERAGAQVSRRSLWVRVWHKTRCMHCLMSVEVRAYVRWCVCLYRVQCRRAC